MNKKIQCLTEAQMDMLPVYRDRWIAIGLRTGPADKRPSMRAVADAYAQAHLPPPQAYFFASSPIGGVIMAMVLKKARMNPMDQAWDQLGRQVWDQVGDQVRDQVRDQVGGQVWRQVRDQVRRQVWDQIHGAMDAPWLSSYNYFLEVCRLQCCKPLEPLMELAKHCGWWSPYKNAAILQDRPSRIALDSQGRLHHDSAMAVEYSDSWGVYAWHGVRVPEKIIIAPCTITMKEVQAEQNAEIQRIMLERFGWTRYLEATSARLLDADVDSSGRGTMRGLYGLMLNNRPAQVLVCTCDSTGKTFHLEVPTEIETCRQAAQWLANEREPLELLIQS